MSGIQSPDNGHTQEGAPPPSRRPKAPQLRSGESGKRRDPAAPPSVPGEAPPGCVIGSRRGEGSVCANAHGHPDPRRPGASRSLPRPPRLSAGQVSPLTAFSANSWARDPCPTPPPPAPDPRPPPAAAPPRLFLCPARLLCACVTGKFAKVPDVKAAVSGSRLPPSRQTGGCQGELRSHGLALPVFGPDSCCREEKWPCCATTGAAASASIPRTIPTVRHAASLPARRPHPAACIPHPGARPGPLVPRGPPASRPRTARVRTSPAPRQRPSGGGPLGAPGQRPLPPCPPQDPGRLSSRPHVFPGRPPPRTRGAWDLHPHPVCAGRQSARCRRSRP